MDIQIPEGLENRIETVVNEKNTAKAHGSGLLDVFATPAMIALMEETSHKSIESYLPHGYASVGTQLNIKHVKATPKGMKVYCISKLQTVEGRKLLFSVEAYDETDKIGYGLHERYIVETDRFMSKITVNNN
ncbi:MAG: thioesterase family protein [Bacteroidales bacterium]|jgi:predicted thioesterase|nr:thioesterase family protein [Bacteroidales bacterium]